MVLVEKRGGDPERSKDIDESRNSSMGRENDGRDGSESYLGTPASEKG